MTANRTITELYQALRPLLLRDIAVVAGGSRSAAAGMETHALNSSWHTGQLAETQAPWAATKNEWATALATHAALPDVHHAAVTVGDGLSLTGQQVSLTAPGSLSAATTNSATGNHTHAIATGAATTLSVASTNTTGSSSNLARADHTHAITSSSNPGAAASLLTSDASGYLQLVRIGLGMAPTKPLSVSGDAGISGNVAAGSLSVTGAATVGQDFTVGANVLYVNQAGTRVGINRAPDQQFDLDVAGAIRGQYLIGKHAIQLSSAVGVWHYDGPAPYDLDFTGSNASHAGVVGTESGGVIYRPGKFGKAVQVAEATTNLITNPSFEYDLTGWTTSGGVRQTAFGKYGHCHLAAGVYTLTTATIVSGQIYTLSFWHRGVYTCNVDYGDGSLHGFSDSSASVGEDGWGRFVLTFTATGTAFVLYLYNNIYDAVQLEQKAYATPYADGSLGTGHSWSGTAHASSSSRSNASLIYAGDLLSVAAGTIMFWADTGGDPDARASIECGGTTGILFILDPGNNQEVYVGSLKFNLSEPIASGWNHFALSWSAENNAIILYQNGVQIGTTQTYTAPTLGATLTISGFYGLDELVILDYAADPKLIRAIYESDAPVFVESSVFHWRSPSASPIWVDEYGLWARSVTGNEILGVYGGDPRRTATYRSWGGVNLEDNDVLIGRAAGGYMHWDDSAQTLSVQGTITALAGSIAGVLTIGTSGEIRQGTGTLGTNYTGLRMWQESGIGRIGGYSNNTLQWYAGTDGRFYAGGGNVVADSDGLSIIGSSLRIKHGSTLKGYLYSSNPLNSALSNYSGLGLVTTGVSGAESISLWAKAYLGRSAELCVDGGGTADTNGVRMYAYSGSPATSSLFDFDETQLSVSIGGPTENLNVSPVRTFIANYVEMAEMTAPGAPDANRARIYLDDNGSGKTRLMVQFSSGSAVQLAIQP